MSNPPAVHRFPAHDPAFVNAYLVETASGAVAVDALLTVSESGAMRNALEGMGKPLRAVLLTHSHPDHYAGLAQLIADDEGVPIIAPQGVIDTIVRDDSAKDTIVGPMFGDEWPATRIFPNTAIGDGESVTFDDVTFTVIDLGPSESPHDSPWVLGDGQTVFLGDQIYDHKHCYLADGHHEQWLANIAALRERFPEDAIFYLGHGGPVNGEMWDWQRGYIETFIEAVGGADWSEPEQAKVAVVARMKAYEPNDDLQFLMELSIEPIADQLGLLESATGRLAHP
jgi:glyoxylase-like metal-dependent hydrolase (beta-lactamase superfamily II)